MRACIQELLDEVQPLENKYNDLQKQKALPSIADLEGRFRLADLGIAGLHKQVKMESDFSQKQVSEVDRLGNEVKRLQPGKDQLHSELKGIKNAQPPMAVTQATYPPVVGTGVPPGKQYVSPLQSHAQMLGQYSPSVVQYRMAAPQAALSGQGGQALRYGSPQPPPAHQYQGSLQQQANMALFRPPVGLQEESPMAQGSEVLSQAIVSPPVTMLAPSS